MEQIEFETKSDRELLVLVAQRTNDISRHLETLNNTVAKNASEIAKIKGQMGGISIADSNSRPRRQVLKDNWQAAAGIVALLCAAFFAVGRGCGWW